MKSLNWFRNQVKFLIIKKNIKNSLKALQDLDSFVYRDLSYLNLSEQSNSNLIDLIVACKNRFEAAKMLTEKIARLRKARTWSEKTDEFFNSWEEDLFTRLDTAMLHAESEFTFILQKYRQVIVELGKEKCTS